MKVILLKDTPGVGKKGDVKEFNQGYVQNFLLPKKLAQIVTPELMQKLAKEERESKEKSARVLEKSKKIAADISKRTFTLTAKVGVNGKMFGAIREKEIAELVAKKLAIELEKSAVSIEKPIHGLGEFIVAIKLPGGVSAKTKIHVVSE